MGERTSSQLSPSAGSSATHTANAPPHPAPAQPGVAAADAPSGPHLPAPGALSSEAACRAQGLEAQPHHATRWERGFTHVLSRQQVREVQNALGVTPKSAQG